MSTPIKTVNQITGVILMTYGSATTSKDVPAFLRHVYPNSSNGLIEEFKRRFDLIGSSPLIEITIAQAKILQDQLQESSSTDKYLVEAGMLHSEPFISDAVKTLKESGASRVLGLLLSPQYSPYIMRGYDEALAAAAKEHGYESGQAIMLGAWPAESKFIELTANRIRSTRTELAAKYGRPIPVIFSTHSLPQRVVEKDPSYLEQLKDTTSAVVAGAGLRKGEWHAAYQSAGHTPEPWLKPDLADVIEDLAKLHHEAVLIVPLQFVAEHLEVLYDLDIAARAQNEELGVNYHRLEVPGTDPLFIEALSNIVRKKIVSTRQ